MDINIIAFLLTFRVAAAHSGVCGGKLYDTEIDICCEGYIIHGGALGRWGCCGPAPHSLSRDLCCNGTIHDVYNVETSNKRCCGSVVLDPTEGICCNNQTYVGHSWCPDSFYVVWLLLAGLVVATCTISILLCVWKKTKGSLNYKSI